MIARALFTLLLALGCGQQQTNTISIKLFPAVLASDPLSEPAAGWTRVEFPGGPRGRAGVYHLTAEPIMTDWNILTFKGASQSDGTMAVVARLNAYGESKLKAFSGDPTNLKKPLAMEVDGRLADVFTLLTETSDRITIYGFTEEEVTRLRKHIETR